MYDCKQIPSTHLERHDWHRINSAWSGVWSCGSQDHTAIVFRSEFCTAPKANLDPKRLTISIGSQYYLLAWWDSICRHTYPTTTFCLCDICPDLLKRPTRNSWSILSLVSPPYLHLLSWRSTRCLEDGSWRGYRGVSYRGLSKDPGRTSRICCCVRVLRWPRVSGRGCHPHPMLSPPLLTRRKLICEYESHQEISKGNLPGFLSLGITSGGKNLLRGRLSRHTTRRESKWSLPQEEPETCKLGFSSDTARAGREFIWERSSFISLMVGL